MRRQGVWAIIMHMVNMVTGLRWKHTIDRKTAACILAGLMGALAFCLIYGVYVLNPSYTSWLMTGTDLTQHYLGWKAYRLGAWQFPIGLTDRLAYPSSTSVVFTDSIPLFAVFFKILSPLLPAQFQYFGLWGIFCFFMQGYLSAKITATHTDSRPAIVLAGLLMVLSPVMIFRMYRHTALSGHWLILLALEPLFAKKKNGVLQGWSLVFRGILLGVLCAAVHVYLLLMCGILFGFYCLTDALWQTGEEISLDRIWHNALAVACIPGYAALVLWLLGAFGSGSSAEGEGLGSYSANLNALINPQGWSAFLPDRPLWVSNQYEGFGYLGLGGYLLTAGGILIFILHGILAVRNGKREIRPFLKSHAAPAAAWILVFAAAFVFALSPYITWDAELIREILAREKIRRLWSIFRATGRLIWIPAYLLLFAGLTGAVKGMKKRKVLLPAFLLVLVCLQLADIRGALGEKKEYFDRGDFPAEALEGECWERLSEEGQIRHLYLASIMDKQDMYRLTDWALDRGLSVSRFYFARSMDEEIDENLKQALEEKSPEDVFLYTKEGQLMRFGHGLKEYEAGDYILCCGGELNGLKRLEDSSPVLQIRFGDGRWLENGEDDEDGVRILYQEGLSYGPYFEAPAGEYAVRIKGEGLDRAELLICSKESTYFYDFATEENTGTEAVLGVRLLEDEADLQVAVRNHGEEPVKLTAIDVELKASEDPEF